MGTRDYRKRESKKPKKDEKKKSLETVFVTPQAAEPEVIAKRKPPKEEF